MVKAFLFWVLFIKLISWPVHTVASQPGVFDHVVVNDTVENAYSQLRGFLIEVSRGISRWLHVLYTEGI